MILVVWWDTITKINNGIILLNIELKLAIYADRWEADDHQEACRENNQIAFRSCDPLHKELSAYPIFITSIITLQYLVLKLYFLFINVNWRIDLTRIGVKGEFFEWYCFDDKLLCCLFLMFNRRLLGNWRTRLLLIALIWFWYWIFWAALAIMKLMYALEFLIYFTLVTILYQSFI